MPVDALRGKVATVTAHVEAPVEGVLRRCREQGINPGYPLGRDYPELQNGLLVALTERRTRTQIDRFAEVLASAIAMERSELAGVRR